MHDSWLQKGKSCSFKSIKLQNSINMISAITSGRYSQHYLKYNTTIAQTIIDLLQVLVKFIKREEWSDIGVIFDNCQCHRTKMVKEFDLNLSLKLYYLPSYSPELAPVETCFSILNSNLIKIAGHWSLNLKSKMGMDLVSKAVQHIDGNVIKSLWKSYFVLLKKEITDSHSI